LARPEALDYAPSRFPGTFDFLSSVLVLPWNERLGDDDVDHIADRIQDVALRRLRAPPWAHPCALRLSARAPSPSRTWRGSARSRRGRSSGWLTRTRRGPGQLPKPCTAAPLPRTRTSSTRWRAMPP